MNQFKCIYKADAAAEDHGKMTLELLTKATKDFSEKGELAAVVYAPETQDKEGDIASAHVIKEMMYDAAKNGVKIDLRHDGKALAKDDVFIAEQTIIQKNDPRFADIETYDGKKVDVTGGWGVILKIDNADLREKYRNGDWQGISLEADAELELLSKERNDDEAPGWIKQLFKSIFKSSTGDDEMNKEELKAALKDEFQGLSDSIKELATALGKPPKPLKKSDESADPEEPKAPVFKGNPRDAKAVAKHAQLLKEWKAAQEIDWTDPEQVEQYAESLKKESKPQGQEGEEGDEDLSVDTFSDEDAEVENLRKENARLRKSSRQPAFVRGTGSQQQNADPDIDAGLRMAGHVNGSRES